MAQVKFHKFVAALPAELEADAIYYVRAGAGFDIYVTNSSGVVVAYPLNVGGPGQAFFRTEPITATAAGQTVFTVPGGYTPGAVIVSLNGATLPPADYTAADGTTVVLASGTGIVAGSVLLVYALSAFEVADALPLNGTAKDSERFAGLLPPPEDGKQYALKDGAWVEVEASGGGSGLPVLTPGWTLSRNNIGDGYAAQDGQLLSRATYPDAWAQAQAIGMVITDAEWLADPLKRGFFSSGDGSTTFRLPDANGKQAGSLGAVFLRGDGALSAGQAGLIQRDAYQGHKHRTAMGAGGVDGAPFSPEFGASLPTAIVGAFASTGAYVSVGTGGHITDGTNGTPRTASETRPLNITVVWTIKLFGAVVNVGSADAAQLASDYANLAGRTSALESIGKPFTKEYVSGELMWSANGLLTLSHGFDSAPKLVRIQAIATTTVANTPAGSVFDVPLTVAGSTYYGAQVVHQDTESIVLRASATLVRLNNSTSGDVLTPAQTRLIVRAWA